MAKGAPALKVQPSSILIVGAARQVFHYTAEPAKLGYRLVVSPAMSLRLNAMGRYSFVKDERGIGYFWPLLTLGSDDPQNLRDPAHYGGRFQVMARDGANVIYSRTNDAAACR